jgi:Cof subfamily protein (haloacid dehalogenase superfamily)
LRPQMTKAIFFDIDGTLVSFKTHKVPIETIEALSQLRQRGIKIFVATGRMLSMTDVLAGIEFDGFIAYNGSCCTDGDKNILYKHTIPQRELINLVDRLDHDRFPVSFMCKEQMFVNYHDPIVVKVASLVNVTPPVIRDPREVIKEDVYQLCIYVDDKKLNEIIRDVLPDCISGRWIPEFADVNMRGISKQSGIDQIIGHYGINLSETMAFGDGGNDISMLRHAAIGVAMANSDDSVKESADYITGHVDDGGLPAALRHFGLIN